MLQAEEHWLYRMAVPASMMPRPSHEIVECRWFSIQEITKKWSMPVRDWGIIIGQLLVFFEGRLPGCRAS